MDNKTNIWIRELDSQFEEYWRRHPIEKMVPKDIARAIFDWAWLTGYDAGYGDGGKDKNEAKDG